MKQEITDRLDYLDVCKGIGIFFIVFGHILTTVNTFNIYTSTYKISIFYVVVGLLIVHQNKRQVEWKKRFSTILVPYFVFSMLVMLFNLCYNAILQPEIIRYSLIEEMMKTFSFRGISTLWFLPSLFFGEWIFGKLNHIELAK